MKALLTHTHTYSGLEGGASSSRFVLDTGTLTYSNLMDSICPGRHLADTSLFLTCASILHAFNITPPLDDNGSPIKLEAKVVADRAIA